MESFNLVYFQNFTNTHEKLEVICERYEQAINEPGDTEIDMTLTTMGCPLADLWFLLLFYQMM